METNKGYYYNKLKAISDTHKHYDMDSFMLCDACWYVAETNLGIKHNKKENEKLHLHR